MSKKAKKKKVKKSKPVERTTSVEEPVEIEKTEESKVFEMIFYSPGDTVYVPQYDIMADIVEINEYKVIQYNSSGGILTLEGNIIVPGTKELKYTKFNANIFETRVFKDFEQSKIYLKNQLVRLSIRISKSLYKIEEMVGQGVSNVSTC